MIKENLEIIEEKIKNAAEKSGRKREDITLLGVTKTIDIERIEELMSLGVTKLGENKVQEMCEKYEIIGERAQWHLIGHLQTNKVKYIIDKAALIHSADSVRIIQEINKRAEKIGKIQDILIEINIGNEESKSGIRKEESQNLIDEISGLKNICVKGLMTVAPFVENQEENRDNFKEMFKLFIDIKVKKRDNVDMQFLSMGMTNDYEVAIEEGANIVRIGTGIFGARNYTEK